MNRDDHGIIGQIQPGGWVEGGDSACWNGHWTYLGGENAVPFVKTFEVKFGGYVRHPDPKATPHGFGAYYANPWVGCISRDQLTGILLGIIGEGAKLAMLRLVLVHILRLFLFTNKVVDNGKNPEETKFSLIKLFYNPKDENYYQLPDLTFMDIWATMLRGFGKFSWIFWPVLCVLDLHLLFGAMFDKYFDNEESDVINFLGKVFVAREHVPTPTSWLAMKFLNYNNMMGRLMNYWCTWRDNCEFLNLYLDKMKKVGIK